LENSVAALLKADGGVAGTAFLFRKEEDFCYWFTCHHVISGLEKLRLGLHFSDDKMPEVLEAEYVAEYSNPDKDVAVLKTKLEESLNAREPLLMGNVSLIPNQTLDVTSIGFTPRNIKNFISGQIFSAKLTYGQEPQFFIHKETTAMGVQKLGNPWNIALPKTRSRVFNLSASTVNIEGGFSGSPVCVTMANGQLLCVGMVNQVSTANKTSGMAITFTELFNAAGTAIPFYPYAQCIIIVVAAKGDEIKQKAEGGEFFYTGDLAASYYSSRNNWQLFKEEANIETMLENIGYLRFTWQLATVYLDDVRELEQFIKYTPQALFFIIDSCSFGVPELKNIIEESDSQFFRAAYLFPLCEKRFTWEQKDRLRKEQKAHMPRVFKSEWVRKRRGECAHREDFLKNVEFMIEEAVKQSMRLHQDEVALRVEQAGFQPVGAIPRPILNIRTPNRG
jgi:hypothetical protein